MMLALDSLMGRAALKLLHNQVPFFMVLFVQLCTVLVIVSGNAALNSAACPCSSVLYLGLVLSPCLATCSMSAYVVTMTNSVCCACSGVDGLAHDPIAGSWGLTPRAYAACAAQAATWGLPLLVLGGGGYDDASAARAWVAVLAALQGQVRPSQPSSLDSLVKHFPGPAFKLRGAALPCSQGFSVCSSASPTLEVC